MTLKLIKNHIFGVGQDFVIFYARYNIRHYVTLHKLYTTSGLSILLHGDISLPNGTSFDK